MTMPMFSECSTCVLEGGGRGSVLTGRQVMEGGVVLRVRGGGGRGREQIWFIHEEDLLVLGFKQAQVQGSMGD